MATTTKRPAKWEAAGRLTVPEMALGPIAGALVGYAGFAILVAGVTSVGNMMDADLGVVDRRNWRELGFGAGLLMGLLLLVSYLYGGFVAGRMARTAGVTPGLLVFAAGVLMALAVASLVSMAGDGDTVERLREAIRVLGVPGSWQEWSQIGSVAGISSLAGMLLGSLAGARLGERRPAAVMPVSEA